MPLDRKAERPEVEKGDAVKIAPSILAPNFAHLGEQLTEVRQESADRIHIDVMDGHFVPNELPGILRKLKDRTRAVSRIQNRPARGWPNHRGDRAK